MHLRKKLKTYLLKVAYQDTPWFVKAKERPDATFAPKGTFALPAQQIADTMSHPEVSPKGKGSAIKMIQFYMNRAGKSLPEHRKLELKKAQELLRN